MREIKRKNTSRVFTLVELLVVVAILGILMCLLLPALSKAKARASGIACSGNLKQIGLGILSYTQDYNSSLPIYNDPNGWCGYYSYWYKAMPSYFGLAYEKFDQCKIFRCPAHRDLFGYTTYWPYWKQFASYGINQIIAQNKNNLVKWKTPSYCVLMLDSKTKDIYDNSFFVNASASNMITNVDYLRHSSGANYLMGDMHAELITKIKASTGTGWIYGNDWDRWVAY